MITLYGIKNCDSVKKARKWLELNHVDYQFHDFRSDGLSPKQVHTWIDTLGWETLVNKRSTTWKALADSVKNEMTAQTATAAILEFLSQKKSYAPSKIVAVIGAGYLIYESIMFILRGNIALAIVGIIFGIILLLTLFDKIDIKIPYSWWVVLIIGFVIFTWVSGVSGTIIMVAFILLLMAF